MIFSHYTYFDHVIDAAVSSWYTHQRVSYVRCKGNWVPYPFQNNISVLNKDDQAKCVQGLVESALGRASGKLGKPKTFDEWIVTNMGMHLCVLFSKSSTSD